MREMEMRVRSYWTARAHDFGIVRRNELKDRNIGKRWLHEMGRYLPDGKRLDILDVGTGTGYFAILLSAAGHRVTGIDLTPAMLAEAESTARTLGSSARFVLMDAMNTSFPDASFDAVVTRNLTWTLPDTELAYREWRRVLRPGGVLLNFDANYGDNVRHNRQRDSYIEPTEVYGHCGVTPELERENAEITLSMPISRKQRPEWDRELLLRCGFAACEYDRETGRRVLREHDLEDAPMFLIAARVGE